jgi:hypothetical protein
VVEEAARLRVPQIVASRRQVTHEGGYTGLTNAEFAATVKDLSCGATQVVRDHGGPYQNGDPEDDWVKAFEQDLDAGFDVLHIDVCRLPRSEQLGELSRLLGLFALRCKVEVGGERDDQLWLDTIVRRTVEVGVTPLYAVMDVGGHIWADRQRGSVRDVGWVTRYGADYRGLGIGTKAHNMDWLGDRARYADALDAYNVAPEFGNVEVDAWLRSLPRAASAKLLNYAYGTGSWRRWFNDGEGTRFERARAALRYHLEDRVVAEVTNSYSDENVREAIRDALIAG